VLLFALAAAATALFIRVERRSPDPVLKLQFFRQPTFTAANVAAFATSFGIFAVFFFTALYLQLVANFSGWKIALEFAGMAAAIAVAALASGRWTARRGPREPLVTGCILAGAGLLWVDSLLGPHVSSGALAVALTFTGLGFGLALVALTEAVLAAVPGERSGMAASTVNTSRQLGGVFAVAVLGAIVDAQLTGNLIARLRQLGIPPNFQAIIIEAVTHGGVPSSAASVRNPAAAGHEALVEKVIQAAEGAFGKGLHISLLLAGAMLLSAAAVSLLAIHRPPLRASAAAASHA
jgi:MFS family permease